MTCDEARARAASGASGAESRSDLAAHLQACSGCRAEVPDLLAAVRHIADGLSGLLSEHPGPDRIVGLALDPDAGGAADTRIRAHLALCDDCTAEVDAVRRAEEVRKRTVAGGWSRWRPPGLLSRTAPGERPGRRAALRTALAVSALGVVVLIYPAYLGAVRLPAWREHAHRLSDSHRRLEEETRALRSALLSAEESLRRGASWSGLARMQSLPGPRRSAEAVPTLTLRAEEHLLLVAMPLPGRGALHSAAKADVEIIGEDGHPAWSRTYEGAELRAADDFPLELFLIIPRAAVPPGAYKLRIVPTVEGEPREPLLEIAFRTQETQ